MTASNIAWVPHRPTRPPRLGGTLSVPPCSPRAARNDCRWRACQAGPDRSHRSRPNAGPPASTQECPRRPAAWQPARTASPSAQGPGGHGHERSPPCSPTCPTPHHVAPTQGRRRSAPTRPHRSRLSATPSPSRSTPSTGPATTDAAARSGHTPRSPRPQLPRGKPSSTDPPTPGPATAGPTRPSSNQYGACLQTTHL